MREVRVLLHVRSDQILYHDVMTIHGVQFLDIKCLLTTDTCTHIFTIMMSSLIELQMHTVAVSRNRTIEFIIYSSQRL